MGQSDQCLINYVQFFNNYSISQQQNLRIIEGMQLNYLR